MKIDVSSSAQPLELQEPDANLSQGLPKKKNYVKQT